jgi:hypothetical protein
MNFPACLTIDAATTIPSSFLPGVPGCNDKDYTVNELCVEGKPSFASCGILPQAW